MLHQGAVELLRKRPVPVRVKGALELMLLELSGSRRFRVLHQRAVELLRKRKGVIPS